MPLICSLENLHEAFLRSVRGKSGKISVVVMRQQLDQRLLLMRQQLLDGTFEFGKYSFFEVTDQKRRLICAASFPERVAFHAMMRICHPVFDQFQTNDSFASRPNRGVYQALAHAQQMAGRYQWFAKLDVRKFFYSIHHDVMLRQLCRLFKDPLLLDYFQRIIHSYEASPKRGLPIGNLTSQYFANHYMAVADHWAKERLAVRGMARYMDDVVLFGNDKSVLLRQMEMYCKYVNKELLLDWHEPIVNQTRYGIPFLGYVVYRDSLRLTGRSLRRYRRKLRVLAEQLNRDQITEKEYASRAQCLLAFVDKADSVGYRHHIANVCEGIYPEELFARHSRW